MSMMDAGASGATSIVNTLLQLTITIIRDLIKFAMKTSGQLGNGALHAAGALLKSAQERADRGQVGLNRFTQLAQSREPVHVTDREVAKILRGELKKHGVTFAVEKHRDGSVTYHVEGKDATIVAHALEQAEKRVDELNRERGEALERGETIPDGDEHHTIDLTEEQAGQLAGELREYGKTLRENGRTDDAAKVEALADQAEQNHAFSADAESLDLVEEALTARGVTPEGMQPVDEAIAEERATIEAEPDHALVDQSIDPAQVAADVQVIVPLGEAQAEGLAAAIREQAQPAQDAPAVDGDRAATLESMASEIELNQSVELTPENTEILHQTFEQQGWQPGTDGDQTPPVMRDVVEAVESEREVQQERGRQAPEQAAPAQDAPTQEPAPEQAAPAQDAPAQDAPTQEPAPEQAAPAQDAPAPEQDVVQDAPTQEPAPEQAAPAQDAPVVEPATAQEGPTVEAPTQAAPAIAEPETGRSEGADPFGADEWGDDEHDIDEPAPELTTPAVEQDAPAPTLPPKPPISAAEAARELAGKTQQQQPVQATATKHERDGATKGEKPQKQSLGQVVGKIREARTEAAKKEAVARQAQRDAGLTPEQQAPQIPTGPTR